MIHIQSCSGDGCRQGRTPDKCNCRHGIRRKSCWAESVRGSLIAPDTYTEPDELPGDGSRARLGMQLVALSTLLALAVSAAVIFWPTH